MSGSAAILVFAKVPAAGAVKTRLTGELSDQDVSVLYEAFVRDTLERLRTSGTDIRLYLAPSNDPMPDELAPEGIRILPQRGADLGARMLNAFAETFAAGYERIVIVGADHPSLPPEFVEIALEALNERNSLVIGPADDGGYYLIGMNELYPTLFRDVAYSQPDVLERTLERVESTDATVTLLPPWYDVDTPASLERLVRELDAGEVSAPHSLRAIRALGIGGQSTEPRRTSP